MSVPPLPNERGAWRESCAPRNDGIMRAALRWESERRRPRASDLRAQMRDERDAYQEVCALLEQDIARVDDRLADAEAESIAIEDSSVVEQRLIDTTNLIRLLGRMSQDPTLAPPGLAEDRGIASDLEGLALLDGLVSLGKESAESLAKHGLEREGCAEVMGEAAVASATDSGALPILISGLLPPTDTTYKRTVRVSSFANLSGDTCPAHARELQALGLPERLAPALREFRDKRKLVPFEPEDPNEAWQRLHATQFFRYVERLAERDPETRELEDRLTNLRFQAGLGLPEDRHILDWREAHEADLAEELAALRASSEVDFIPMSDDESEEEEGEGIN
ncbi:unnamed protein product [Amoebophrya sp. A25]|nr:unnamed protein product [Amoebophrya sp. A25]|eukprot:GSA25T00011274001.1